MLHLDTGNTGFMLLCSSLVMLMTPGLAFFYGGLVGRKNVLAIMIQSFISLCWTTVVWYVCGYSGGIVVPNTAGLAALASVIYVGRRRVRDSGPHSIPLVALGTGLLWFGWYGFNAGSEFRVDATTAAAFINTDLAASFAGVAWMLIEWMTTRKPKLLGLLTGSVAGLATITPAAGYVSPQSAVLIGIAAGVV